MFVIARDDRAHAFRSDSGCISLQHLLKCGHLPLLMQPESPLSAVYAERSQRSQPMRTMPLLSMAVTRLSS